LVNGKVWPYLEVEPRKYRFRMLNGSNARFYHLTLVESDSKGVRNGKAGPSFYQIGTDGGLLPAPVKQASLLMTPAERFDIVVDFSNSSGKYLVLANDAPAPYPGGGEVVPADVMLFKVASKVKNKDTSSLPSKLVPISLLAPQTGMKQRYLGLSELDSNAGNPIIGLLTNAHWNDPVTESPKVGSTEIWNLITTTGDAHPIHVHMVQFQVLERRAFDVNQYNTSGKLVYTGNSVKPDPNERPAWKDTIRTLPGMVTRIIAKYDLPTGTVSSPGQKFRFVWHCHILEHEDNDMMRPYDVVG
jgi:spore coat protein A